jgi:hypothetical protein
MKTTGAVLLCSIVCALSGCGSAVSPDYYLPDLPDDPTQGQTALATIRGQTVGVPDADPNLVRIALVWFPVSPGEGKKQFIQPVRERYKRVYFDIEISQEPPPAAIGEVGGMRYAQGEIVLYEDRNRDNLLTIVPAGYTSPDRVLGRAEGLRVWRLKEGAPASPDRRGEIPITQGWSFTYGPIKAEPDPGLCDPDPLLGGKVSCRRSLKEPAQDVSSQDVFFIKVSNTAALQSYTCSGFWGTSEDKTDAWSDMTPGWNAPEVRNKICNPETCDGAKPGQLDLPVRAGVPITCNPEKTLYHWRDCEPDPHLCGTFFCHDGYGAYDPAKEPRPANWPSDANCTVVGY